MMRYLGMGLLFLVCALLSAQFSGYQRQRLEQCEGLLALLLHMKSEISLYLRPYPDCLAKFQNGALAKTGLLDAIMREKTLVDAWVACRKNFVLNDELCKQFYAFCQSFGKGYAEDEERLLVSYIQKFEAALEEEKRELPRTARLVRTLLASGGCAVVVLLL